MKRLTYFLEYRVKNNTTATYKPNSQIKIILKQQNKILWEC